MHSTDAPLFTTPCIGATIAHVHVFPTHIRYEQKFGMDISVEVPMIASVERHAYQYGYVILSTTSRRRIICMVDRKRVDALYIAICKAQRRGEGTATTRIPAYNHLSGFRAKKAAPNPDYSNGRTQLEASRARPTTTPAIFPPKESKRSRAREPVKAKPYGLLRKP
jgi:hypothetical protein